MYDLVIIGAGPAGLTAAIYALRVNKHVLLLEKENPGGAVTRSPRIENYPGCSAVGGTDLAQSMLNQATELGAEIRLDDVREIRAGAHFTVIGDEIFTARSVILATGTRHRELALARERELTGHGISYCAVCDGPLYRGKHVAVIGGGNSALTEAILLSEYCAQVTVVQNLETLTAEQCLIDTLAGKENVNVILGTTVAALEGQNALSALVLERVSGGRKTTLAVSGAFVAIGQAPDNAPFRSVCRLDEDGYIIADETCRTGTPGLFAAGDCRRKSTRQIVTATADGAVAALAACRYAEEHS